MMGSTVSVFDNFVAIIITLFYRVLVIRSRNVGDFALDCFKRLKIICYALQFGTSRAKLLIDIPRAIR